MPRHIDLHIDRIAYARGPQRAFARADELPGCIERVSETLLRV